MGCGQGTGASDSCQHVWLVCWKLSCIPWKKLEKKHYPWTPLIVADSHRKYSYCQKNSRTMWCDRNISLAQSQLACQITYWSPTFHFPVPRLFPVQHSLNILRVTFCLKCPYFSSKIPKFLVLCDQTIRCTAKGAEEETTEHGITTKGSGISVGRLFHGEKNLQLFHINKLWAERSVQWKYWPTTEHLYFPFSRYHFCWASQCSPLLKVRIVFSSITRGDLTVFEALRHCTT